MTGRTRSATLRDDPETIRRRIRRYSLFLVLNRDAGTRRALEGLIRQAERQLAASMSTEGRITTAESFTQYRPTRPMRCTVKFPTLADNNYD